MRWIVVGDILRKQSASVEAATAHQGWLRERHPHPPEFDRTRRAGNDCVNEWRVRLNISQRDCGTSRHSLRRRLIGCQSCNRSKDPRQCTSGRMTQARHIASLKVMGEGGQGNPLMPMLFSLGMHPPVRADQARLRPSERISAFLDDVCVVCFPERVQTVVNILAAELWNHAHIQVHDGKTQTRLHPQNHFTTRARIQDLNAVVWGGDAGLDPCHHSLKVLRRVREDPDVHATATKQASAPRTIARRRVELLVEDHGDVFELIPLHLVGRGTQAQLFLSQRQARSLVERKHPGRSAGGLRKTK